MAWGAEGAWLFQQTNDDTAGRCRGFCACGIAVRCGNGGSWHHYLDRKENHNMEKRAVTARETKGEGKL